MFHKMFQGLVGLRYDELNRMHREMHDSSGMEKSDSSLHGKNGNRLSIDAPMKARLWL